MIIECDNQAERRHEQELAYRSSIIWTTVGRNPHLTQCLFHAMHRGQIVLSHNEPDDVLTCLQWVRDGNHVNCDWMAA